MSIAEIIELIILIIATIGMIASIVIAITKGKLREFIIEKMEEAEKTGKSGKEKLEYVISAVKDKYRLTSLMMNIRKFIEMIISATKNINSKGK